MVLIWLAATAWAVARVLLEAGGRATDNFITFGVEPVQQAPGHSTVLVVVVIAAGPPALGLVIAMLRRPPSTTALLVACAVLAGLSLVTLVATADGSPAPEHRFCQEYSGGDNECPGD
jgi:hypothetical protein